MDKMDGVIQMQLGSVPRRAKTEPEKYEAQSRLLMPLFVFPLNVTSMLLNESVKRAPTTDTLMRAAQTVVVMHWTPVKFAAHKEHADTVLQNPRFASL